MLDTNPLKALKFCDLKTWRETTEKLFQLQILATEKFQGIQGCENVFLIQMVDIGSIVYSLYVFIYIYTH